MFSTNDKDFVYYVGVVIFLLLIGFAIFSLIGFNKEVKEEQELRELSHGIMSNYVNLQDKKDMSCFINLQFELDNKKVKLYLDEDRHIANCGDQIVQFTHYAMKSPFTLEVIEYP